MKKFFVGVLIVLMSMTILSAVDAEKLKETWRLDGTASADLPRNFRLMTDAWHNNVRGQEPTRQGLDNLNASASAQPSAAAMSTIYEKIHELAPNAKIFMLDLRRESHGFVNSVPVSLHVEHNQGNPDKSSAEVERIELEQLKTLRGVETTFQPMGNADTQLLKPVTIVPRVIQDEREVAEKVGFNYVRIAAADGQFPAPELVDDFIQFVANLPPNAWLHFHCHAGHGRTTSFLVMYDIMKNPDVSLEDICKRQYLLSGTNLLLEPEGDDWYSRMDRDRAKKIRLFYEFMQGTRAEQIGLSWSEWIKGHDK